MWRRIRRAVGVVLLVAAGAVAVLFVLGTWNPWRLVELEYRFGNPLLGALVVPPAVLVGLWLALPVGNETRQQGRIAGRVIAGAATLLGVIAWGLFGNHVQYDADEIARSDDGERAVALVRDRDTPPRLYLRIWTGSGLATREVGDLGRVCGPPISAQFVTNDQFELRTPYGTWPVDLDPQTGAPRQVLGPRCPDGPIPATLGE